MAIHGKGGAQPFWIARERGGDRVDLLTEAVQVVRIGAAILDSASCGCCRC